MKGLKLYNSNMTKRLLAITLCVLVVGALILPLWATAPSTMETVAYDDEGHPYVEGQLIVGYRQGTTGEQMRSIRGALNANVNSELRSINAQVLKVTNARAKEALASLKNNPRVAFAEYDYIVTIEATPNDPGYAGQPYLPYMNAPAAWDVTFGTSNITVAVLDTGINTGNPDMVGSVVGGYNFVAGTTNYADDHGHGTMVASVIGARTNNGIGIAGVAGNSRLLAVKVMNSSGSGTYSTMIKGIEYAVNQGAQVINMSLGGRTNSTALKQAVDYAISRGVVIVAAAGNEGSTTLSYPAAFDNVIGVGAVDLTGAKMSFSNTGTGLTVMAGGSARVATSTSSYTNASGTSFSSPYVAGLVALMMDVTPGITPENVMSILAQTALDLGPTGYDTTFGYGLVHMGAALTQAKVLTAPPVVDVTPPVLVLTEPLQLTLYVGESYTEPGFVAVDDVDGDLTAAVQVDGQVNTTIAGQYTLSYSVRDKAGNLSDILMRTIDVLPIPTSESGVVDEELELEIELEPETAIIRDVSNFDGSLKRNAPPIIYSFTLLADGIVDLSMTHSGRTAPTLTVFGTTFTDTQRTFSVPAGTYTLEVASQAQVSFKITVVHPEREVAINIPQGPLDPLPTSDLLPLVLILLLLVAAIALYYWRRTRLTS